MILPLLASSLAVAVFSQEQEHFLDVKQIVKGTIEAMQRLPDAALQQQQNTSTQKPEDLMQLFRLPADIMTKLAVNAGYLNEPTTSTYGPWIVARSRDGSEEESGEWEEVRRKRRRKRPEDDGLVSLKDLLRPLPPVQQTLPQQSSVQQPLQPSLPQPSSFVAQADPIRAPQDPLYRREVTSDGQVLFVPVLPQTTTSSPSFIVATPPPPPRQSDQRFDAPTFPPQFNPFQLNALPPRIVLPPSPAPPSPSAVQSLPGLQLPLSDPVAPPAPSSPEITPSRKPLLVQPVIRSDGEAQKPLKVKAVGGENSEQTVESASMEDDAVVHSVESEPAVSPKKSVTKTALRVRTIEHSKSETKEVDSEEAEEEVTQKTRRKTSHPAKKRAKIMEPEEDKPTTTTAETPTAELPSTEFKKGMETLEEGGSRSRRRRVHASKTLRMGRKGNKALAENEERVSSELEQLSEESDVATTMTTPKRRRKAKKVRTTTTEEPTTTTTMESTTTTEEPTTTTEAKKRKRNRKRGNKKSRKTKKVVTTTTPAPLEVSAQHCSNIRSFARQFGVLDVEEFAKRHCEFIENYYVELTCDRVEEYVDECQRLWSDERRRSRD